MIKYIVIVLVLMSYGCTTNLAWRGVVINTSQEATTDGRINNRQTNGDNSVAAEKQTDFDADLTQ